MFFFGGYEGLRSTQGTVEHDVRAGSAVRIGDFSGAAAHLRPVDQRGRIPRFDPALPISAANPQFIRTQFPGNQIPLDRINPIALQVLQQITSSQPNMRRSDANNYLDTRAQDLQNDSFNAAPRSRRGRTGTSLFARYSLSNEDGFTPENLPGFGADHDNRVQNLSVTLVSPTVEAAADRDARSASPGCGCTGSARPRTAPTRDPTRHRGRRASAAATRSGCRDSTSRATIRSATRCCARPADTGTTSFQVGERVTWSAGRALASAFGGDARHFIWDMLGFFQNRGYFQFTIAYHEPHLSRKDGTRQAAGELPARHAGARAAQAGTPSMNMRQTTYDAFIQDDWRVAPTLTVNAGLRYELQTPLRDINKILTNLDFSDGAPVAFVGGQNGYPAGLVYTDENNFAPRVGFALGAGRREERHSRPAAAIFYAYPDMNLWCNQVHNVPLVFPEIQTNNAATPAINDFRLRAPGAGPDAGRLHRDRHAPADSAHRTGERQLRAAVVGEHHDAGRLPGRVGSNLDRSRLVNNAAPGPRRLAAAPAVPDDLVRAQHRSRPAAVDRCRA